MAHAKEKIATCPVCGAQEMAMDKDALEKAMQDHMRQLHNLDVTSNVVDADIKETGLEDSSDVPIVIPVKGEASDTLAIGPDFGGGRPSGQ